MFNTFVLIGVIVFLAGINVYERVRCDKREKDYLNRLMSRDFSEYVTGSRQLGRMPAPVSIEEVAANLAEGLVEAEEETSGEPKRVRVGA